MWRGRVNVFSSIANGNVDNRYEHLKVITFAAG
jgi:hypothetical protein